MRSLGTGKGSLGTGKGSGTSEPPAQECDDPEQTVYMLTSFSESAYPHAELERRYPLEGMLDLGQLPLEGELVEQDGKHLTHLQLQGGPRSLRLRYTAPVVCGASSGVPALVGLREMSNAHCVFLLRRKQIKIVDNEHHIRWPFGTRALHLSHHEWAPTSLTHEREWRRMRIIRKGTQA